MTRKIFGSIALAAALVFIASVALIMGVLYPYFLNEQFGQMKAQASLASQGVSKSGEDYFEGLKTEGYRLTWIDPSGKVLYDSDAKADEMENHLQREEVQQAIREGEGESTRYSTTLLQRQLYVARLVGDGSIIRIADSQHSVLGLLLGTLQQILIVAIIALGLSFYLAWSLTKRVVRPLNEIDLNSPAQARTYKELQPLLDRLQMQQKQIERDKAQRVRGEQMRREFTANVSHELKTPLQTISGSAELLAEGLVKPEDTTGFGRKIYSEAKRLIVLIDDIIGLSHLDEQTGDLCKEELDLLAVTEHAVSHLISRAKESGVEITCDGESAMVLGDLTLLNSIVYNLCDNAVKYSENGGNVTVTVRREGSMAELSVADEGIGIPLESQDRIFERFYRVDKSRSKAVGGTGLGLSIVKHAVQLHDGQIELESAPGVGTRVTVRIPLAE